MNNKASKSQIQFPPLLNLCNDRPHVDSTFRNWEKNNSPYLNDMISPVYIKDSGVAGVYDYYGRKHQIVDGNWTIDGTSYISNLNHKFTRTVLDSLDMLSVAFDNDGKYWYLNSSLQLMKEDQTMTQLEVSGSFVTSRMVYRNDNLYIALISKLGNNSYIKFYVHDTRNNILRERFNKIINWYRQIASSAVDTNSTFEQISIDNIDPIINIGFDAFGVPWVSLVSNYGSAIDTRYNGFATYDGYYGNQIGNELTFSTDSVNFNAPVHYKDTASASYEISKDGNVFLSHRVAWGERHLSKSYTGWRSFSVWVLVSDPSELSTLGLTHGMGYYLCTYTTSTVTGNRDIGTQQGKDWEISNDYWYSTSEFPFSDYVITENVSGTFFHGSHYLDTSYDIAVVNREFYNFAYVNISFGNIQFIGGVTDEGVPSFDVSFNVDFPSQADLISQNGWDGYNVGNYFKGTENVTVGVNEMGLSNTAQLLVFYDSEDDDPYDEPYVEWNLQGVITGTNVALQYDGTHTYTIPSNKLTAYPCVVLDNGNFYTMTGFVQPTTSALSTNEWLPMAASVRLLGTTIRFDSFSEAIHTNNTNYEIRSNSVIVNQNLFAQTIKYSRNSISPAELAAGTAESTNAYVMEVYNSNCTDLKYMPGTSRYTGFNYYSDFILKGSTSGAEEDRLVYCTIGHRVKVNPVDNNAGFKLLFNTTTDNSCYIQGISWANSEDYIGTLLTPWQEVSEDFYPASFGDRVIYKNKYDEIIMIQRVEDVPEFTAIFDNKYILLNTDNYWNLYDSSRNKWFHYASDWNFRCLGGSTVVSEMSCYYSSVYSFMFRYLAASQNQVIARTASRTLYSNPNIYPVASWQTPLYSKARILVGNESLYGANEPAFSLSIPLGVDVYHTRTPNTSTSGIGDAYYQYTYYNGVKTFNTTISGQTYTITTATSSFLNPSLFATYLDGAGNNDLVYDLKEAYTVSYYNNVPTFIYLISSEVNGADAFFVIQGQFYAIMDDKICSVSYSNSALASKDPIIDINGMKFVGNNPMIAFFWSERYKAFYSFTGDANLEHIYNANKFSNLTGEHYYDKSTQTIYVPTDKGLLCFGPKNTYILEQFKNVSLVQFTSDNVTHIEDGNKDYSLVYYDTDGYEVNNVDLESSFYGTGATESTSIDRWNITLYDLEGTHPSGEVKVSVRSLTDITVKSEEKTIKITPDMWDKWSNSILITYNPKLIKGQGIRIYVNSPFIIQSITAHVMDNGTGTLSNKRGMI